MKTILALLLCSVCLLSAQVPPVVRSAWTTNTVAGSAGAAPTATNVNLFGRTLLDPGSLGQVFWDATSSTLALKNDSAGSGFNLGTSALASVAFQAPSFWFTPGSLPFTNRVLFVNANLQATNVTSSNPSTDILHPDGSSSAASTVDGNSNYVWNATNLLTVLMATNNGSTSNVTVNFDGQRRVEIFLTNNITITNFSGALAGTFSDVAIHLIPQLIPRGIGAPTLGAPSFGTYVHTNLNSPIWPTVTNEVVLSISTRGTNQYWSMSEWR